ncbi:hypothetical protein F444_09277 [Phytophthora nicotianae P1976]|uniref:FLZ-type domain-containing protein n=2 Tax=Phytophthora nicotianae TaxID=4792 RepID=A0A081A892_PHYNI|nr:hypothetical protein F444_09277 [Phytophthora nicotianae P1976]
MPNNRSFKKELRRALKLLKFYFKVSISFRSDCRGVRNGPSESLDHQRIRPIYRTNSSDDIIKRRKLTFQLANTRSLQSQSMNQATRITSNQQTSETKTRCSQEGMVSRPSFASRMLRLVFKRRQRSADERAKSWPGCAEPAPVPTKRSQPSATIAIPHSFGSSAPSTAYTRPQHARKQSIGSSSEASWRQRQVRCANCEQLFFKSMSIVSSTTGYFCSLDCKTNLEYLTLLQGVVDAQDFGFDASSAAWTPVELSCSDKGQDCSGWS